MSLEIISIYIVAILCAVICIYCSNHLYRNYRINFLLYYQNFLTFFLISALINSVGITLGTDLISRFNADPWLYVNIIFTPILIPLTLFSLYYFIRFAASLLEDSLPRWFFPAFFALWLLLFLMHVYSIFIAVKTKNILFNEFSTWLWDISFTLIQYLVLLFMVWRSRSLKDRKRASGIRDFSLIYFFSLLVLVSFTLSTMNPNICRMNPRFCWIFSMKTPFQNGKRKSLYCYWPVNPTAKSRKSCLFHWERLKTIFITFIKKPTSTTGSNWSA
jgi:hypothetical protein